VLVIPNYEFPITHADGSHMDRVFRRIVFVCFFPHNISKTDAARITNFEIETFNHESRKPIYFGVKMSRKQGTKKHCRHGSWHYCECWLLVVEDFINCCKSTATH